MARQVSGGLDQSGFLQVCRRIQDLKDEESVEKERRAIDQTSFSAIEVEGYRQVFEAGDVDLNGDLTTQELRKLLQNPLFLNDRQARELGSMMSDLDEDGDGT